MIEIAFAGFFQCRLATDPDHYAAPRGADGWTFALPGEPDLDRVIRFHDPVTPRRSGPRVEVLVREMRANGLPVADSPLVGARVEMQGAPVFEGRNGAVASSAQEPIVPFALRLAAGSALISGSDPITLAQPAERRRRAPVNFEFLSDEALRALGTESPLAFRMARRAALRELLAGEMEAVTRQALEQRLSQFPVQPAEGDIRVDSAGFRVDYDFELRGPNQWNDPTSTLGTPPATGAHWQMRFWMGAWDADALCGYTRGTLTVT